MNTRETLLDERLVNRFDYDSDYGTVLNRFIMQAASKIPLTVYGTGEQTRAFIHIENSMDCVELAIQNPGKEPNKVEIFNQVTETHTLNTLAELIKNTFHDVEINYIDNPRKELKSNQLMVSNKKFKNLGLNSIILDEVAVKDIYTFIIKHNSNININNIMPSSKW
jgi:UDP-sulfoquinovose synthase